MDELTQNTGRKNQNDTNEVHVSESPPTEYCAYCNAPLHPDVYFCLVCATPYRNVEEVITPARPKVLFDEDRIARKVPYAWTLFWSYCSVLLVSAVLGYCVFHKPTSPLFLILASVGFATVTGIFAVRHWKSLVVQLKVLGFRWEALAGIASLAVFLPLNYSYAKFLQYLGAEGADLKTELYNMGLNHTGMILLVCVFPAILEEIGFRGLLQHWLQVAIKPWRAIVLSSFLFAVLHVSVISLPYLFFFSLALGWTKWKTKSLYPGMLMHFLHNFFVLEYFW